MTNLESSSSNTSSKSSISKIWYFVGGIAVIMLFFSSSLIEKYNTLIAQDESVKQSWGEVENQYQRRFDLIPNLVSSVKGAAAHEKETFEAVTQARSNATQTNIDVKNVEEFSQFQAQQTGLSSALSRLLMIQENYPDLKANQNFLALQTQLEGTENRITVARKRYNQSAQKYNTVVRSFPTNLVAGFFNFEQYQTFGSLEGAKVAPIVEF